MTFDVAAEAYDRFMGRYSEPLATLFAERVGVRQGQRALDVGCGPGAMTGELVRRLGPTAVVAVDPSPPFVQAARSRYPAVEVVTGVAEQLPFPADSFDVSLAQLVVHFMADPVAGITEMGRVTRPGGLVATTVWDHAGGGGPISRFWRAAQELDPTAVGESELAGAREGQLAQLSRDAGLTDVESFALTVEVQFDTFEDWWVPFTLGVGPAGAYVARLDAAAREALRDRCWQHLPPAPFSVRSVAWGALGNA